MLQKMASTTTTLNTSEIVWDELDHSMEGKRPIHTLHMWELLQECWKSILGDHLMKLIEPRASNLIRVIS